MANIWEEFDKSIDTEGLAKDVEEAAENGGRREVPHDTYEVAINKLELTKSKKGDPMVTCWMKIVEGEYKGSLIFMNQVVTQAFQIHIANEFMRALVQEMETPVEVQFKTYSQYAKPWFKEKQNNSVEHDPPLVSVPGKQRLMRSPLFKYLA